MTNQDIKTTLARLHTELEQTQELDEDLRAMLLDVDTDIHELLAQQDHAGDVHGVTERLESMAADFAARHPSTEGFFRELINALGRMGI